MNRFLRNFLAAVILVTIAFGVVGCLSDQDPDNTSPNPWNQSGNSNTGRLPSTINEGR